MRQLIVTADDVGLHPGMTAGALAAADAGIVTAVSVATVGRAFLPAAEALLARRKEGKAPDVGVHLTLVGERPLSPPDRIPTLLGREGAFLSGYPALAGRYALGRLKAAEVEIELRLQIERLLASGLPVVHLNSHQHLHVLPRLFEIVLRLAQEYAIPFVRIPNEPALGLAWTPRKAQLAGLNALGRHARRHLEATRNVAAPFHTVGLVDAGHLTAERLRRALRAILEGVEGTVGELVCHPGIGDADLAAAYDWDYLWDRETAALCDPELPAILAAAGIAVVSFSALLL